MYAYIWGIGDVDTLEYSTHVVPWVPNGFPGSPWVPGVPGSGARGPSRPSSLPGLPFDHEVRDRTVRGLIVTITTG